MYSIFSLRLIKHAMADIVMPCVAFSRDVPCDTLDSESSHVVSDTSVLPKFHTYITECKENGSGPAARHSIVL
jgi:hypothetical protein